MSVSIDQWPSLQRTEASSFQSLKNDSFTSSSRILRGSGINDEEPNSLFRSSFGTPVDLLNGLILEEGEEDDGG